MPQIISIRIVGGGGGHEIYNAMLCYSTIAIILISVRIGSVVLE